MEKVWEPMEGYLAPSLHSNGMGLSEELLRFRWMR